MDYIGNELELFQHATNWKAYFNRFISPYIKGEVLEAGCGLGINARYLCNASVSKWHFLEPDARLCARIEDNAQLPVPYEIHNHTTTELQDKQFDTILYIDVIEHIEDSKKELETAASLLKPGGHLIILVPAYMSLYSPFDQAIGHFRRYDKKMLKSEIPGTVSQKKLFYLDSLGVIASFANKLLLKQSNPTAGQVKFWDRVILRFSKVLDPMVGYSFGKSLVGVYQKK